MIVIAVITFIALSVGVPVALALLRMFGVYTTVRERECKVYVLFGNVVGVIDEPGFHWLWLRLGWAAPIVHFLGRCHSLDLRLDQEYLRSQPVNSEEGAPMGIGIWYEMAINDPVDFLFKNADPRGSLRANVGNAAVRSLSNMKLEELLEERHRMSQAVRGEVSTWADEWGYGLGSVYIRKVHFRDDEMIQQIEEKVVNRLRQVTSAIRQEGANQVNIIRSTAERLAAVEFAKAATMRPAIVGGALRNIAKNPRVLEALMEVLEIERLTGSAANLRLMLNLGANRSISMILDGGSTSSG